MTDDQFKQLRSLITMISDRVDQIEIHLRRQDDIAIHRQHLIYDWCAPAKYKQVVESEISLEDETLGDFLARINR